MDASDTSQRIFANLLAPLVLGGAVRPGHAVGPTEALSLQELLPSDSELSSRVMAARVRRARRLAPVDTVPVLSGEDSALGAALGNILHAANPAFDTRLRRRFAEHILDAADGILEQLSDPRTVGDALARHTWFARLFELRRTDTRVTWWSGSQTFLGREPPTRLEVWPDLRRVHVTKSRLGLFELTPLAVSRDRLTASIASLLSRTPLTDLATCTRSEPTFAWAESTRGLVAQRLGRTLALRALETLPANTVDDTLGRTTRALLTIEPEALASGVGRLLAERAVTACMNCERGATGPEESDNAVFAQQAGAYVARRDLPHDATWSATEREALHAALGNVLLRRSDFASLVERLP